MAFHLTIVSPDGLAYQGEVENVVLPGSEGDFGVLAGHERFLSALRVGAVEIREAERSVYAAVSDGYAEVRGRAVVVLVDACELSTEIDAERARLARERAERAMQSLRAGSPEEAEQLAAYESSLKRAITRAAVAERR